jgi:VanZ family protein|tara:strand:+ start:222 stop:560 length:339 start_codon:yes stop_codon:yes gene_type:complete
VIYTLLITIILLIPSSEIPRIKVSFIDKIAHVLIHGFLSLIWLMYCFSGDKYHISVKNVFVVLFICFSYGVVIEAAQHWFTLTRSFDIFDIVANGFGSLLGLLSYWVFRKII